MGSHSKKKSKRRHSHSSSSSVDRRSRHKSKSSRNERHRDRSGGSRSRDRHSTSRHRDYKRSKRRDSSTSSNSSDSSSASNKSVELLKRLESNRMKLAIEKKRLKEEMKAKETPEEKRARRLKEKQLKEMKRRERMGWDNEYQHYTNQDNPFGDAHLTSTFVWGKKLESEGLKDATVEEVEIINRRKQHENRAELEKVKKSRLDRERERMEREEEMVLLQRTREAAQFEEWERQEDQFHLEQARLRSKIRIHDGRAKPIDLLAQYISTFNSMELTEMEMHEPYSYLNGLSIQDLEDLLVDIKVYQELEKGNNNEYWGDMIVIVEDELKKLKKRELGGEFNVTVGRREGIHQSVAKEISEVFRGKSAAQLSELKLKIESKLQSNSNGVDYGYWESLLSQLKAHMARARLMDKHQDNLRKKLELLKAQQQKAIEDEEEAGPSTSENKLDEDSNHEENDDKESVEDAEDNAKNMIIKAFTLYDEGSYSPVYLKEDELDDSAAIISTDIYEHDIEEERRKFFNRIEEEVIINRDEMRMQKEARKGMSNEEAEFSVETTLDSQVYLWSDKYRPRKPRYFNRVHTGFEWNKYNQTHYDMDNPPPKIVQGYKFNIFYPDLIDKASTPQYFLTPCNDNKDFAILKFHAGPPYEDIAFKIVNREWEFSYKRGFRCQFHNNIFQLWFHFKRYRYRR